MSGASGATHGDVGIQLVRKAHVKKEKGQLQPKSAREDVGSEAVKHDVPKYPLHVNVTFCTHVGWDGALILAFMLVVAVVFAYITYVAGGWS